MLKPLAIGAAMAAMMLFVMHDRIMAGAVTISVGALVFVLVHLMIGAGGLALSFFVPSVRRLILHHRPSLKHVAAMLLGAVVAVGSIHVVMHVVI